MKFYNNSVDVVRIPRACKGSILYSFAPVNEKRRVLTKNSINRKMIKDFIGDDVAEWLRRSVSDHTRSTRVGSNPVVRTTNRKPTVNSAVHPSEVGK